MILLDHGFWLLYEFDPSSNHVDMIDDLSTHFCCHVEHSHRKIPSQGLQLFSMLNTMIDFPQSTQSPAPDPLFLERLQAFMDKSLADIVAFSERENKVVEEV